LATIEDWFYGAVENPIVPAKDKHSTESLVNFLHATGVGEKLAKKITTARKK